MTAAGLRLPDGLVRGTSRTAAGRAWLDSLHGVVHRLARRWEFRVTGVLDSRYGAVLTVRGGPTGRAVLKLSPPGAEALAEAFGLAAYQGAAVPALYERDDALGALLVQELRPGTPLAESGLTDEQATEAVADVLDSLWSVPVARLERPRRLAEYTATRPAVLHARWTAAPGLAPEALLGAALRILEEWDDPPAPVILHNDLHHHNVLSSGGRWAAVDPKCSLGHREADLAPMLRNPWRAVEDVAELRARNRRRLRSLGAALGLDQDRARRYALANSLDLALWSASIGATDDAGYLAAVARSLW
ncbi:aminoglycoside phosphotransferase family protein [Kitasatospora sp. NPDC058444]|uniref:aminoglycoside phosphotransferase family protein n=1 Tax=Kitasatospora sp. NPDC058444 TaxID=3346504 RepID=UPI003668A235